MKDKKNLYLIKGIIDNHFFVIEASSIQELFQREVTGEEAEISNLGPASEIHFTKYRKKLSQRRHNMNQIQFCYWLQGYLEIGGFKEIDGNDKWDMIKKHLAIVIRTEKLTGFCLALNEALLLNKSRAEFDFVEELKKEFVHVIDPQIEDREEKQMLHDYTPRRPGAIMC